jgi:hypothetical protein
MAYMNLNVIAVAVLAPAVLGAIVWWLARRRPMVAGLAGLLTAAIACALGAVSFMSGDARSPYQGLPPLHLLVPITLVLCLAFAYFAGVLRRKT